MEKKIEDRCFARFAELEKEILMESNRQLAKWGKQRVTPFEWLCYLGEEVGELNEAVADFEYRRGEQKEICKEAIQVATLALKICEMYLPEVN